MLRKVMTKAQAIPEEDLQATVEQMARAFGWLAIHIRKTRGSEPGFPDLLVVRAPHIIIAELKSERGQLSKTRVMTRSGRECPSQVDWAVQFMEAEGALRALLPPGTVPLFRYFVWRPSALDEIEEILR